MPLYDLLNMMQSKRVHMAIVSEKMGHVLGVITLEDVFEQLIQEEIFDETDVSTKKEAKVLLQMANTFIANAKERAHQRREFLKELKQPASSMGRSEIARTLMGRHHHTKALLNRSSSDSSLMRGYQKSNSESNLLTTESTLVFEREPSTDRRTYGTLNTVHDDLEPVEVDRAMVAQNTDELWFNKEAERKSQEKRILIQDDGEEELDDDELEEEFVYEDVFEESATQPLLQVDNQK
eukprot:TRINITY_DN151_c0_g1_i8.p2 TRINITY_DN151_c0_g1~~TRINITY_DN151_c0_g1_i8.p2  ORF type:complete len:237 (-),score=85.82 TRINITY_DN151_c0_g1_i8:762-1472(-)